MKKSKSFLLPCLCLLSPHTLAHPAKPDTVKVGVYLTSIHAIDFKQKEYALNLWLWLK